MDEKLNITERAQVAAQFAGYFELDDATFLASDCFIIWGSNLDSRGVGLAELSRRVRIVVAEKGKPLGVAPEAVEYWWVLDQWAVVVPLLDETSAVADMTEW